MFGYICCIKFVIDDIWIVWLKLWLVMVIYKVGWDIDFFLFIND